MYTKLSVLSGAIFAAMASHFALAEEPSADYAIEQIFVEGHSDGPRLDEINAGKILAGKKASSADLTLQPNFVEPNLRQMFSTLPGLLVSDQQIPSIYNVNYRGLGNPHESEFVAFFQNNVPLASDLFGYPTLYYLPPAQRVERIEFVRGGSGLLHGPQIGPTLNFITRRADAKAPTNFRSDQGFGSNGLYSTYNELRFAKGDFGFMASLDHRSADGPRNNEDYEVNSGYFGIAYEGFDDIRLGFDLDIYQSDSGEAGRLSSQEFANNRDQTLSPFNRIEVERVMANFSYNQQINSESTLDGKLWYSYQDRFSRRSAQFTSPAAEPATTNIDQQEFDSIGIDLRYAAQWGESHILTLGTTSYLGDSPRTRHVSNDIRSNTQRAEDQRFKQDRQITYNAVFIENLFRFGDISVVPTLRYERVNYDLEELQKNAALNRDAINIDKTQNQLLMGLGLNYQLSGQSKLYANISDSYRPQRFDDLANPNSELAGSNGPNISQAVNIEFGYHSEPIEGLVFDISAFRIDFDDKIEQIQVNVSDVERVNSGNSRHQGIEFSIDYDLLNGTDQSFKVFANGSLLEAETVASVNGALVGNTPAFAPDYLLRTGFLYNTKKYDIALTATLVDKQFWQDSNQSRGTDNDEIAAVIPAYEVLDLSGEYRLASQWAVYGGINNLLNQNYYSRVRNDGIEPALERTFFAGVRFEL